jgi:hypothetical protein
VTDRAARLVGVVYGSQAQQLKQTATNFNLQVELATGGTLYDARQIRFVLLIGDGESKSITINLSQAPFAINFSGNNPQTLRSFAAEPSASGVTATATLSGANLMVLLSAPLPQDETLLIDQVTWSFT